MARRFVSPVTGTFVENASNPFLAARKGGRQHAGTDWRAANGSPIVSPVDGVVVYVNTHSGYGPMADILGDDGNVYRMATHRSTSVQQGQRISAGDPVGRVGARHLHMEIIPPGSEAYRNAVNGKFGSTSYYGRGRPVTLNPAEVFGFQPGTRVEAGRVLFGDGATASASQAVTPEIIRDAQQYLRDNGVQVPVTGQMDEATAAGIKAWNATPQGAAFAQRYGLQRPDMAPERASQPTTSLAAANDLAGQSQKTRLANLWGRDDFVVPQQVSAYAPQEPRPPQRSVVERPQAPPLSPLTSPELGSIGRSQAFRDYPRTVTPNQPSPQLPPQTEPRLHSAPGMELPQPEDDWQPPVRAPEPVRAPVPGPGAAIAAEVPNFGLLPQMSVAPPTMAPLPNTATQPPDPMAQLMLGQTMPDPFRDYMEAQAAQQMAADRQRGIPVMSPAPGAGPPVVDVPSGQSPFPRPNPMPPQMRGRSGVDPYGYRWRHIPQQGGPTMLRVNTPGGRSWATPLGLPGGAGLYNEWASSFLPVIQGF